MVKILNTNLHISMIMFKKLSLSLAVTHLGPSNMNLLSHSTYLTSSVLKYYSSISNVSGIHESMSIAERTYVT
jgi:hypothetical protein